MSDKKSEIKKYSRRTVAAKSLFEKTCRELTEQRGNEKDWRYRKPKNMYCRAATTFKPTIAQISVPTAQSQKNDELRTQCSRLIIAAMGSNDLDVINKRKRACGEYERSKVSVAD